MAARGCCWRLVHRLVLVLGLVTAAGGAGPLTAGLPGSYTLEFPNSPASNITLTASNVNAPTADVTTSPPSVATSTGGVSTSSPGVPTSERAVTTTGSASTSESLTSSSAATAAPGDTCPDPHQHVDRTDHCLCDDGYKQTGDPQRWDNNTCRFEHGGYLGDQCNDVSDCNYNIHHAVCDGTCQCMDPYVGFKGETTCFDNTMGWGVAIKTAGITILVLALAFLIAFGIKGCSRSVRQRLGRRVPWLRRTSDISFNSGDFFVGGLSQAILDRPPSYAEEDTDKPPAYEEVFPEQGGVVNAGFSADSIPASPERQRRPQQPAVAEATAPPSAVPVAPQRPAGRGHRRGLSGPAAIHLGTAEQGEQTASTEQTGTETQETAGAAAAEQTRQPATAEQTSPSATVEHSSSAASAHTSTDAPKQTTAEAAKLTSHNETPEQANGAGAGVSDQSSPATDPKQASQTVTSEQNSQATDQTSGASTGDSETPSAVRRKAEVKPEAAAAAESTDYVRRKVVVSKIQQSPAVCGGKHSPASAPTRSSGQVAMVDSSTSRPRDAVRTSDKKNRVAPPQPPEVWEDIPL